MIGRIDSGVKSISGEKCFLGNIKIVSLACAFLAFTSQCHEFVPHILFLYNNVCVLQNGRSSHGGIPSAICFPTINSDLSPYRKQMHWSKTFPLTSRVRNEHLRKYFTVDMFLHEENVIQC